MILQIAPYFGYLASLFLVLALVVTNDLRFRWFSFAGNVSFIIYSVMIFAIPVFITNLILLVINIYYLRKIYTRKEDFHLIRFKGDEELALRFIRFYHNDLKTYYPGFAPEQLQNKLNFVVLRDLAIANIFSVEVMPDGDAKVVLNYTPPRYRDFKVGRFIFDRERDFLYGQGIRRVVYPFEPYKKHITFLKAMGFTRSNKPGEFYSRNILPANP